MIVLHWIDHKLYLVDSKNKPFKLMKNFQLCGKIDLSVFNDFLAHLHDRGKLRTETRNKLPKSIDPFLSVRRKHRRSNLSSANL